MLVVDALDPSLPPFDEKFVAGHARGDAHDGQQLLVREDLVSNNLHGRQNGLLLKLEDHDDCAVLLEISDSLDAREVPKPSQQFDVAADRGWIQPHPNLRSKVVPDDLFLDLLQTDQVDPCDGPVQKVLVGDAHDRWSQRSCPRGHGGASTDGGSGQRPHENGNGIEHHGGGYRRPWRATTNPGILR